MFRFDAVPTIQSHFETLAAKRGFTARGPFSERHGSWQIVFYKTDRPGLSRFTTFAVTEEDEVPDIRVEICVTVEDSLRAAWQQIASFLVRPTDLDAFLMSDSAARAFEEAMVDAERMTPTSAKPNASGARAHWPHAASSA
jgi:hypothetical protein